MKNLCITFLMLTGIATLAAQCDGVSMSVSSASETSVNLYTPSFFLLPNGADNIYDWEITEFSGELIHRETVAQGTDFANSFMLFNHAVPTIDSMKACLTVNNATAGLTCLVCDTLFWKMTEVIPDVFIGNWDVLSSNAGVLPVSLLDFQGEIVDKQVELSWKTVAETSNKGFEVQRSRDARKWETIDFATGFGTSDQIIDYQSTDRNPLSGFGYYRLKQLDFDDRFTYSNIVMIEKKTMDLQMSVFPNPSRGNFQVELEETGQQLINIVLVDAYGRVVWQADSIIQDSGEWRQQLQVDAAGMYLVKVEVDGEIWQQKVLISR